MVLNFWAFWCDTWKAEMPSLNELAGRQDEMGFRWSPSAWTARACPSSRAGRAAAGPVPRPARRRRPGLHPYGVPHVPTVVIMDRAGIVRFTAYGYPGNHVVLRELRKLAAH